MVWFARVAAALQYRGAGSQMFWPRKVSLRYRVLTRRLESSRLHEFGDNCLAFVMLSKDSCGHGSKPRSPSLTP